MSRLKESVSPACAGVASKARRPAVKKVATEREQRGCIVEMELTADLTRLLPISQGGIRGGSGRGVSGRNAVFGRARGVLERLRRNHGAGGQAEEWRQRNGEWGVSGRNG